MYAFSIMCAEVFTQELPFRGYDAWDIKKVVLKGERPSLPTIDVPEEVRTRGPRNFAAKRQLIKHV